MMTTMMTSSAEKSTHWDNIPETPIMSLEGLLTEEEKASAKESLPAWLLRFLGVL
jgi:hypothetical protein